MAKLTSPLYSEEAHGRVGAVIYRNWRGAATASSWAAARGFHTPLVNRTMLKTSAARKRWWYMKEAQRNAWKKQVRIKRLRKEYGIDSNWSGYHWWIHCALVAAYVGQKHAGFPPTETMQSYLWELTPRQFGIMISLTYQYYLGPSHWRHWIEMMVMGPHSPGRSPRLKDCRRAGSWKLGFDGVYKTDGRGGLYTLYARTVDSQGLTSPYLRTSIDMQPFPEAP